MSLAAHVHVTGGVVFGCHAKHFQSFQLGCFRGVLQAETHCHRAAPQAMFNLLLDLFNLLGGCALFCASRISRGQKCRLIAHHTDAYRDVPDTHAKVDGRLSLPYFVPQIDIRRAHLQFQRRCHAVHGLVGIILRGLAVLMHVDNSWCHNQSLAVDGCLALERVF